MIRLEHLKKCPNIEIVGITPGFVTFRSEYENVLEEDSKVAFLVIEVTCPLVQEELLLKKAQVTVSGRQSPIPLPWRIENIEATINMYLSLEKHINGPSKKIEKPKPVFVNLDNSLQELQRACAVYIEDTKDRQRPSNLSEFMSLAAQAWENQNKKE